MAHLGRLPDLLIIGQERWDEVERRNQLLIRALARRNVHTRFLFVENAMRPRELPGWRWPSPIQVAQNIWALRVIRPVPESLSAAVGDRAVVAQIRRATRRVGLERPWIWTQAPHTADLIDLLDRAGLIYDLTDDWPAFETDPIRRELLTERVGQLARAADVVLACSPWLCDVAERLGVVPSYVPNAIDGDLASQTAGPALADLARLPRPRLGYVGTLHAARLDIELLVEAATLQPTWSFALLGPDSLDDPSRARLLAPANIHHLGVIPHRQVQRALAELDVGLIPNLVTDFTRSLDPLKTYEYLEAGLPVISTPAGVSPELADELCIATTAVELVDRAQELIAANEPERADARRALVAGETWDARARQIERLLAVEPMQQPAVEVSVVIVSFGTRELLARCLEAVEAQHHPSLEVLVVDNGSTDRSIELVRERFPWVELIELGENRGFGAANNVGFDRCQGEFVLLLNSDAFLHEGTISEMVAVARRRPRAGAVGPRLLNADGTLQRSAWPFPGPGRLLLEAVGAHRLLRRTSLYEDLGTWSHDQEREVDFLVGACLLMPATALAEAGGFDERFWMYGEEADLERRLKNRGWSAVLAPNATVTHVGAASSTLETKRLTSFYNGQMLFLRHHRGAWAVGAARVALLVGSLLRRRWAVAALALRRSESR